MTSRENCTRLFGIVKDTSRAHINNHQGMSVACDSFRQQFYCGMWPYGEVNRSFVVPEKLDCATSAGSVRQFTESDATNSALVWHLPLSRSVHI